MSTLRQIVAANDTIHTRYDAATAVFTGATQGVGLGTLKAFVRRVPHPTVVIVGRSRERFEEQFELLQSLNTEAKLVFVEGQVSLIKDVDAISTQITHELPEKSVDFIFMAQGSTPIEGRRYTAEGLDEMMALI